MMHVTTTLFSARVICDLNMSLSNAIHGEKQECLLQRTQGCSRPAYLRIHIYRQLQLVHSEEEQSIALTSTTRQSEEGIP